MKLYIVRHGQTDWNKNNRLQGLTDIPLNNNGINQALNVKKELQNIHFDICFTSPLTRAKQTAELIVDNQCSIIQDSLLIERGLGKFEGQIKEQSQYDVSKYWNYALNCSEKDVEPVQDIINRVQIFLNNLITNYPNSQNVLIVSHGGVIRVLLYILNRQKEPNLIYYPINNCVIYTHDLSTNTCVK